MKQILKNSMCYKILKNWCLGILTNPQYFIEVYLLHTYLQVLPSYLPVYEGNRLSPCPKQYLHTSTRIGWSQQGTYLFVTNFLSRQLKFILWIVLQCYTIIKVLPYFITNVLIFLEIKLYTHRYFFPLKNRGGGGLMHFDNF